MDLYKQIIELFNDFFIFINSFWTPTCVVFFQYLGKREESIIVHTATL